MKFQEARAFITNKLLTGLSPALSYHSPAHTADVYAACEHIANEEGVDGEALTLLLTAALFHDAGFLERSKDHEVVSCHIAQTYLPAFQYSDEHIATICRMIMATRLPQSPKNKLEEILCDADLDYLGRDDFFQVGDRLYREFINEKKVKNETEWNNVQLRFLESHNYYTPTATKLRKQKKDDHLRQIREKVAACY